MVIFVYCFIELVTTNSRWQASPIIVAHSTLQDLAWLSDASCHQKKFPLLFTFVSFGLLAGQIYSFLLPSSITCIPLLTPFLQKNINLQGLWVKHWPWTLSTLRITQAKCHQRLCFFQFPSLVVSSSSWVLSFCADWGWLTCSTSSWPQSAFPWLEVGRAILSSWDYDIPSSL